MDYNFLTLDEVIEIHKNQVSLYGRNNAIRDKAIKRRTKRHYS